MSLVKSDSKLSGLLEKLPILGPGEVGGILWVGVKSVNPQRTTCGGDFSKKFNQKEKSTHKASHWNGFDGEGRKRGEQTDRGYL